MQSRALYADKKTGQHKGATRDYREELTLFRLRMKETEKGLHDIKYNARYEEGNGDDSVSLFGIYRKGNPNAWGYTGV
jgi:hypothetical protein